MTVLVAGALDAFVRLHVADGAHRYEAASAPLLAVSIRLASVSAVLQLVVPCSSPAILPGVHLGLRQPDRLAPTRGDEKQQWPAARRSRLRKQESCATGALHVRFGSVELPWERSEVPCDLDASFLPPSDSMPWEAVPDKAASLPNPQLIPGLRRDRHQRRNLHAPGVGR